MASSEELVNGLGAEMQPTPLDKPFPVDFWSPAHLLSVARRYGASDNAAPPNRSDSVCSMVA
ncbi:MAG: hypothetical protein NVS3B21_33900 [Acidimicrobiales bacterium]